ncbi:MAG: hypothetical protein K5931_07140, partial [Lachnospiraceae bacterium]|nr:hypothetical protein [Lachnospiraceae bacterium]
MDKGFGKTSGNGIKFRRFMAMLLSVAMIVLELPAMAVPALAATKVSTNAGEALETEANATKVSINAGEALETEANADVSQAANDEASFEDETDVVKETDSTEELEYYEDSNIQFAYVDSNADAGRKILTLAGDEATVITEVIDSDYKTVAFDSTRDFVFYVVPLMGWTWDSTDVPVTLEGSYKLKGASEAVKLKKDTDYTVEKAGLTLASGGYSKYYDTYDFDLAYKVTIKANTTYAQYLAKYETAFKQGSGYITQIFDSTSADDVPEITVYVCKKDSKSTSGVTKNGKIGFDKPVYSDGLTDPGVSPEQDSYRWTYDAENTSENLTKDLSAFISEKDDKKYVEAALTLKAADGSITELTRNTESAKAVIDDTKNMAYFWDSKKNELTLSKALVNYAYVMSKPVNGSSKLNISFSLSEKEYEAESVNILLSDATYVTAKGYVTGKTVQDIDTKTGINVIKYNKDGVQNVYITLTKASDADSADRAILGLEYSIKGTSGRQTAEKGSWSYVGNQAEGYKVDTKGTDFSGFVIPAEKLTGDIVLYPKTGEKVILAGGWVPSVTIPHAGVDFSIAGVPKEITTSPEDYPAETSGAITGEDFNFTLRPTTGLKITELSVDMYDKTNKTSTRYTVGDSEHPLIEKDFGEYSLSKITGKIQVNVRTSRISSSSPVLSKVLAEGTEDANIKLYRINDKKEIVTAATTVHTENTPLTFKAVPADGFAVKSVAISTDGGKSF